MSLSNYTVEEICVELRTRGVAGIISVKHKTDGRLDMWWGDRTRCLGYTYRLAHEINSEMDEDEEVSVEDECLEDEAEEGLEDLCREFPQIGQYL